MNGAIITLPPKKTHTHILRAWAMKNMFDLFFSPSQPDHLGCGREKGNRLGFRLLHLLHTSKCWIQQSFRWKVRGTHLPTNPHDQLQSQVLTPKFPSSPLKNTFLSTAQLENRAASPDDPSIREPASDGWR